MVTQPGRVPLGLGIIAFGMLQFVPGWFHLPVLVSAGMWLVSATGLGVLAYRDGHIREFIFGLRLGNRVLGFLGLPYIEIA